MHLINLDGGGGGGGGGGSSDLTEVFMQTATKNGYNLPLRDLSWEVGQFCTDMIMGHYKTWTVDYGLDCGLDYGLGFSH